MNWTKIPDHLNRILTVEGSGSGETNSWRNLIIHQPDANKIYFYTKDPCETTYQFLMQMPKYRFKGF